MSTPDRELIDECLAGRTESFGRIVVRYQDRLYNSLFYMLGSSDAAADAAQDAFVLAFQKLNTFRGNSAFYSWLYRIAMNAAISAKRKNRRMTSSLDANREDSGVEPTDGRDDAEPSHAMEVSERQALVTTALSQLAEEFREVLVLKEMDGLKYEEIAEIVGCPIGTVRSRIHRARSEMREKLRVLMKSETDALDEQGSDESD